MQLTIYFVTLKYTNFLIWKRTFDFVNFGHVIWKPMKGGILNSNNSPVAKQRLQFFILIRYLYFDLCLFINLVNILHPMHIFNLYKLSKFLFYT